MGIDGIVLLALAGLLLAATAYSARKNRNTMSDDRSALWADAVSREDTMGKVFLAAGRRLAEVPMVHGQSISPAYRSLEARLLAADAYGGSVEVYIATQAAGLLIAALVLLVTLALASSGFAISLGAGFAGIAAYFPYDRIRKGYLKKKDAVEKGLADFAEMLVLPLSQGVSPLRAMEFAARETTGPVADEAKVLVRAIRGNTLNTAQAFELAAARLATPDARSLFSTLMRGQQDGTPIIELLREQAATMRTAQYHSRREQAKKLPNKLVLIMGVHFMPFLLAIILVPIFLTMGKI